MASHEQPVKTKALLLDPSTMSVVWMNESAAENVPDAQGDLTRVSIEQFVPMADTLGVREMLSSVAETGAPRHLSVDLISSAKGGVAVFVSAYRLPGGNLLVLMENSWRGRRPDAEQTPGHSRRR